ncbi:hypothetical protein ABEY52_02105 [Priestia aryabhattai]
MRRGGSPAARGKRSLARKPTAVSQASHTSSFVPFFVFRLGNCMSESLF